MKHTILLGVLNLVFWGWLSFCGWQIASHIVEWGKRVEQNTQVCARAFTEADDEP